MMNNIPTKTKEKWNKYFEALDTDNSGTIKISTLSQHLDDFEADPYKRKKLKKLLEEQKDITLNYTDFLAKVIDIRTVFSEEDIINTFKHFDTSNSGEINIHDISKHMNRRGEACSVEDATKIFSGLPLPILSNIPQSLQDEFCTKPEVVKEEVDEEDIQSKIKLMTSIQEIKEMENHDPQYAQKSLKVDKDGNRIQMTLGTFKKYIFDTTTGVSLTPSMNTPFDRSFHNRLRHTQQSITSMDKNSSIQ